MYVCMAAMVLLHPQLQCHMSVVAVQPEEMKNPVERVSHFYLQSYILLLNKCIRVTNPNVCPCCPAVLGSVLPLH